MKLMKTNQIYKILPFVLVLFLLNIGSTLAQNSTSNPFSMYALGELRSQSSTINSSMGNTGIGISQGNFLNLTNPASYSEIDSLNFIFDIAIDSKYSQFKSQGKSASTTDVNFSYMALGWRVNDWIATGLGVSPFSTTGYSINVNGNIEGTDYEYPLDITGSGDLSKAYGTIALSFIKNLSIGMKASFLFGSKEQVQTHDLSGISSTILYNTTTDYFHNFYFDFGVQYALDINSNRLVLGAIYTPKQDLVTKRNNYSYSASGGVYENEEIQMNDFIIPEEIGFGASFQNQKNMTFALDFGIQKWSSYKYSDLDGVYLKDKTYIRGGFEYLPSTNSIDDLYKRITYRAGVRYEKSYLSMRGQQMDEEAVSFGVSIPIRNGLSHIDTSVEIGQFGTVGYRLIREDYVKFKLGFCLTDLWFQQRVYN